MIQVELTLKRASASPLPAIGTMTTFDVLAGVVLVSRIFKAAASPVGSPWMDARVQVQRLANTETFRHQIGGGPVSADHVSPFPISLHRA
jgi:hypothetical protein